MLIIHTHKKLISLFLAFLTHIIYDTNGLEKRVIGGEIAPLDKYRWAVLIKGDVPGLDSICSCGASILQTGNEIQWLITAAHCFFPKSKGLVYE